MKYYTAFLFEGLNGTDQMGNPLHVTHKYLGEQPDHYLKGIVELIDNYVKCMEPMLPLPPWPFTREDHFGPNKETRVLLPKEECTWAFWPELKKMLDPFRKDDFPTYQPHVSTELPRVDALISSYALMGDGKILKRWAALE